MLETAIVGGGLSGLALARGLDRRGRSVALFEARPHLGGRILTVADAVSGMAMDLGPTWFWPETQPLVTALVADLGLASFAQFEDGPALHLADPDKVPERIVDRKFHDGARRVAGGMASLVDALVAGLPANLIFPDHVLTRVTDRGDHVGLTFTTKDGVVDIEARHVVLALPPRLLDEHVRFEPELDQATCDALRDTETWMAAQAKIVVGYDHPAWRETGYSGCAFVSHAQAVIGEVFDACDDAATGYALGGFLALSPQLRADFDQGLPMLMTNQMVQLFGPSLEQGIQHYQDWSLEPFTCSALDRNSPRAEHPDSGNPLLRRALWGGKLQFGGSETAARAAGYLEGALEAARRVEVAIDRATAVNDTGNPGDQDMGDDAAVSVNAACLAQFRAWVGGQGEAAFDDYHVQLKRGLATQQRDQLTQRALLNAMEDVFARALVVLSELDFDKTYVTVERGRSSLTPQVLQPFGALMQSVMDDVVAFNRTSCALSNFPDEHRLSPEYRQTILRDIAAAWQEFALSANRLLLADAGTGPHRRSPSPQPSVVSS